MGREFKAVLVASVTAHENLASVWLQNRLGVVPVVAAHDLSATHLKESFLKLVHYIERCLGETSVNPSNLLQEYDDSVQYMSILQERTQGIDRCLPSYDFTLLTPKHLTHRFIFPMHSSLSQHDGSG